jgi:predicted cupin superfamily sugar epimerase
MSGPASGGRDDDGQPTAETLIARLGLRPLEFEGGWYAETWRSADTLAADTLPARYGAARAAGTAIYYLLTPETVSRLHRLTTDEIFHFYAGDPAEMLQLHPDGRGEVVTLGADVLGAERPQVVVPRGTWQGCRLRPGGRYALLGCTVAPGFEVADFEGGARAELVAGWPVWRDEIERLTP